MNAAKGRKPHTGGRLPQFFVSLQWGKSSRWLIFHVPIPNPATRPPVAPCPKRLTPPSSAKNPGHTVDGFEIRSHHFEAMVETIACWHLQGDRIILGFLGWCEKDFVHPHYHAGCTTLRQGTTSRVRDTSQPQVHSWKEDPFGARIRFTWTPPAKKRVCRVFWMVPPFFCGEGKPKGPPKHFWWLSNGAPFRGTSTYWVRQAN